MGILDGQNDPQVTACKETGTSTLQPRGTESCQQSSEAGRGFTALSMPSFWPVRPRKEKRRCTSFPKEP